VIAELSYYNIYLLSLGKVTLSFSLLPSFSSPINWLRVQYMYPFTAYHMGYPLASPLILEWEISVCQKEQ